MQSFADKLAVAQASSDVMLLLRPLMPEMPAPIHWQDDPFFPFSKAIIRATRDVVCGYMFDFAAYLAHGAAGAVALERSIAYAGDDVVTVLHGPFAGPYFVPMIYEDAFHADAATLVDAAHIDAYTTSKDHGAFVMHEGTPEPAAHGAYWPTAKLLTLGECQIRLATEDVLYAAYGDDHAEQVRAALEAMRA